MSDPIQKITVPDFVNVRLSAAGKKFAGKGETLHSANAHMSYTFVGDTPQRVVYRGDWTKVLAMAKVDGEGLYEIVTEAQPAATDTAQVLTNAPTAAPAAAAPAAAPAPTAPAVAISTAQPSPTATT